MDEHYPGDGADEPFDIDAIPVEEEITLDSPEPLMGLYDRLNERYDDVDGSRVEMGPEPAKYSTEQGEYIVNVSFEIDDLGEVSIYEDDMGMGMHENLYRVVISADNTDEFERLASYVKDELDAGPVEIDGTEYDTPPEIEPMERTIEDKDSLQGITEALEEQYDSVRIGPREGFQKPLISYDDDGAEFQEVELTVYHDGTKGTIEISDMAGMGFPPMMDEEDDGTTVFIGGKNSDMVTELDEFVQDYADISDDEETFEYRKDISGYSWDDVGGLERVKQDIQERVIDRIENPGDAEKYGLDVPGGILLHGPPGTGKTLLAKAVASESDLNFHQAKASELTSMWYGESSSNIDQLFEQVKEDEGHTILFLDEFEALARKRGGRTHEATERMVSTFLDNLDGTEAGDEYTVIAATNMYDQLDPAIIRPGRFDRHYEIGHPDTQAREEILQIHTRDRLVDDLDYRELAEATDQYSGAELEQLTEEAAERARLREKEQEDADDFEPGITDEDFYAAIRRREDRGDDGVDPTFQ